MSYGGISNDTKTTLLSGSSNISNQEEDYGTDSIAGLANSAKGEGTTTAELVAKFRFLNVCACVFVVLFRILPIALNPIRWTILMASPIRLILECFIAVLVFSLLFVEGRLPVLGEKVLVIMQGFVLGGRQCLDLDVAKGRVTALMIIAGAVGLINYLTIGTSGSSETPTDVGPSDGDLGNTNTTAFDAEDNTTQNVISSTLFIIIRCAVFSPTILILSSLSIYTLYIMHIFPEYAQSRGYPDILSAGRNDTSTDYNVNSRSDDGYQSVPTPSWAQPLNESS